MTKILILANCQSVALVKIISEITDRTGKKLFEIVPCKPVYEMTTTDGDQLISQLNQCDILLYQMHKKRKWTPDWQTSEFWVNNTTATSKFSFPSLYFSGYNPELTYIRKKTGQHLNEGLSDYHDKRMLLLYFDGKSDEYILNNYRQINLDKNNIKQNCIDSINELRNREKEQKIDILSATFVENNFRKERLFHTFNHPSNRVLFHVVEQLLALLSVQDYILPTFNRELLGYDIFPIIPTVMNTLDLEFYDRTTDYSIQNTSYTPAQLISLYTAIYRENTEHLEEIKDKLSDEKWHRKKKLVLHIGQSKTATTSIQNFLMQSDEKLQNKGIYYPQIGLIGGAHFDVSDYYLKSAPDRPIVGKIIAHLRNDDPKPTLIDKIKSAFESSECETLVLSSELFEGFKKEHIERLVNDFSEYDISVVCVLRGRLSWISSMYNEVVKKAMYVGSFDQFLKFNETVTRDVHRKLNTMVFLQPWIQVFGQSLEIVDMDKHPSMLEWILNILGIQNSKDFIRENEHSASNQSVDAICIETMRRFYLQNQLLNIPYDIATRFTNRVNFELKKSGLIKKPTDTFFSRDDQIINVTSHFLEDDLLLQQFCGFDRNDLNQVPNFNLFDDQYADQVYQEVKTKLSAWYENEATPPPTHN